MNFVEYQSAFDEVTNRNFMASLSSHSANVYGFCAIMYYFFGAPYHSVNKFACLPVASQEFLHL